MQQLLILVGVFLATAALMIGAYVFLNRERFATAEAARARLKEEESSQTRAFLKDDSVSEVPFVNRMLQGQWWTTELAKELARSGSTIKPARFMLVVLISGVAGMLVGSRTSGLFALMGTALGLGLPLLWLRRKRTKRLQAFEAQLPDAIDMLVSAMRAGYSFQAATRFMGEEMSEPLGPEFARFYDEQRLGIDVRTALLNLQERIDSLDMKMFVTAVLIQRETGGNLAEVLTNISDLMRERFTVRGEIQTMTAEPKLSGRVLTALPVVLFLGIYAINPTFMRPLIVTPAGQFMLAAAAVSVLFGYFVMMKIADIDF